MYRLFLKKVLLLAALMMASTFAQLVHAANAVDIKHRYALVIGNAKYSVPANVLLNPVNDAALVSDALRKRGFQAEHRWRKRLTTSLVGPKVRI